ncbi:MAG: YggT family protein [Nitrospira sp.]|nr:YggT family protein [Nitrospira sp.]MDH4369963.1 YggT family protein [Nitrospira sp.]MDH5348026.1 YggT family protein [Nitrospira sp.]MDH5498255.1 YggT family protein [Nitrospira sp.]MDH5724905.1 YggT family protein [Nitrospira sp.]
MGNTLLGLATVLDYILTFYSWIVIARALISWVNPDPWNPIVQFLNRATEPVLAPIRRRLGLGMGIDLSPLIAIAAIWFLQIAVVQSIKDAALRMN